MITPNEDELSAMCVNDTLKGQLLISLFDRGVETIWLRKGAKGSEIFTAAKSMTLSVPSIQIVDTTGAGDAALAGWVFGYVNDEDEMTCLQLGHTLALQILKNKGAVDDLLTPSALYKHKKTYYND
jgi:pseudouridine kinase